MTKTEALPAVAEKAPVPAGRTTVKGAPLQDTAVVNLPPGLFMTSDHRYYFNGIGPYPSVTTILDIMSKPALITWKAKEAAKAMHRLMTGEGIPHLNEQDMVLQSLKMADEQRDTAGKIGTGVHLLADMASRGQDSQSEAFQIGSDTQPYLMAFRGFLGRYSASNIISSEHAILNLNGYAGTYDLIMRLPCEDCRKDQSPSDPDQCVKPDTWLIDIKTSKGVYPEYGLQLTAYVHGDYIILPNDPRQYPMPHIDRTGILHLRPDQYPKEGWRLIEYATGERDYIAFLGALELYQWREERRFSTKKLRST